MTIAVPAAEDALPTDERLHRETGILGLILLSVAVQVPLALFLGHAYDLPIFMATGFLAGTGRNPYVAQDLSGVFHSRLFSGLTSIGYPPPWPLVLGGMYQMSYARLPSLILYSFALKAPVIAANIGLALMVGSLSASAGAGKRASRGAVLFILFNPLLLYTTAAWGQFDTVVAFFALLTLSLLHRGKILASAVSLALCVSLKPIALPLLPLCALYAGRGSACLSIGYAAVCAAALALFSVVPFVLLGWSPQVILQGWNAHVAVAGGLSWLTFVELATGSVTLPPPFRFLGFLWLPALVAGVFLTRPHGRTFAELLRWSLRLILLFFLTRAWLSEPNVALVLPVAAILAATGGLDTRTLHALWIIPLVFTFFNASIPQVVAPAWPGAVQIMAALDERARSARLILRCFATVPWLVVGWRTVFTAASGQRSGSTPQGLA
jgi:hypothetical protein